MRTTKAFHFITILSIFLGLVINVYASEPGGANVTSSQNLGTFPNATAGNVSLVSGNITQANLGSNMSTFRWAGLLGNVSGNIVLGDSGSNVMFTWAAAGRLVYASRQNSVNWSALGDATQASVINHYSFLSSGTSDSYNVTFSGNPNEAIDSGIFSLSSDYAVTLSSGADTWKTYSLNDSADIVFVGDVEEDGDSYRTAETVDYQMIIPEDGTLGNTVVTTYYLWIELI